MSGTLAPVQGHVVPRIYTAPNSTDTDGADLLRFVTNVLKETPDPWQVWWCNHVLERGVDGLRFRMAIILVARQNGKSHVLRWLVLWVMFTGRARFVLWTSQSLSVSGNMHRELSQTIKRTPALAKRVKAITQRYEEKTIELLDGTMFRIVASTPDASRSLSVDMLVVDELRTFTGWDGWNALLATTAARPNAMIVCASNAGDDTSIVLNTFLDTARAHVDDPETDTFLAEWSAPEGASTHDVHAIAAANPAMGHGRSTLKAIESARANSPEAGFRTEYLCQRVTALDPAIPWGSWQACSDTGLALTGRALFGGYDVALDSRHSTLAVAARLDTGKIGVRVYQAWDGPGAPWDSTLTVPIMWAANGPAAAQVATLSTMPRGVKTADSAAACMRLADLVAGQNIVHAGDPLLDDQISGAGKARSGDRWSFTRRGAGHVDAVYAVAYAVLALEQAPKPKSTWDGPLVF